MRTHNVPTYLRHAYGNAFSAADDTYLQPERTSISHYDLFPAPVSKKNFIAAWFFFTCDSKTIIFLKQLNINCFFKLIKLSSRNNCIQLLLCVNWNCSVEKKICSKMGKANENTLRSRDNQIVSSIWCWIVWIITWRDLRKLFVCLVLLSFIFSASHPFDFH